MADTLDVCLSGFFTSIVCVSLTFAIMAGSWTDEMTQTMELVDCDTDYRDIPKNYRDNFFEKCNPELIKKLDDNGVKIENIP